ncbi:hypothetical protein QA596_02485 [Balneolales bacterium ANBcel1]|nr:hypothetical protein [Balneolales bacterium ANBcel1]
MNDSKAADAGRRNSDAPVRKAWKKPQIVEEHLSRTEAQAPPMLPNAPEQVS